MIATVVENQNDLSINISSVEYFIDSLVKEHLQIECDEVLLNLVSTEEMQKLHKQFFGDPSTTDCISFPIDSPDDQEMKPIILGEIFVCPATAISYAKENNTEPYDELALYIVHGVLHLIGYDDIEEKARALMRAKEEECLTFLFNKGYRIEPQLAT